MVEAAGAGLVFGVASTLIGGLGRGLAISIVAALVVLGVDHLGLRGGARKLPTPVKLALVSVPFLALIVVAIAK